MYSWIITVSNLQFTIFLHSTRRIPAIPFWQDNIDCWLLSSAGIVMGIVCRKPSRRLYKFFQYHVGMLPPCLALTCGYKLSFRFNLLGQELHWNVFKCRTKFCILWKRLLQGSHLNSFLYSSCFCCFVLLLAHLYLWWYLVDLLDITIEHKEQSKCILFKCFCACSIVFNTRQHFCTTKILRHSLYSWWS